MTDEYGNLYHGGGGNCGSGSMVTTAEDADAYCLRRRVTELERDSELNGIRLDALESDVMRYCLLMGATLGCSLGALVVVMLAVVL